MLVYIVGSGPSLVGSFPDFIYYYPSAVIYETRLPNLLKIEVSENYQTDVPFSKLIKAHTDTRQSFLAAINHRPH